MPNNNLTLYGEYSGNILWTINYVEFNTTTVIHPAYEFYAGTGPYSFTVEDGIAIEGLLLLI